MLDEIKLNAVRNYLEANFADYEIEDRYDFDRDAQTFRLIKEKKFCLVTVSSEFLEDHSIDEILIWFDRYSLVKNIQQRNKTRFIVTSRMLRMEEI